jgi:hypothetical protein
MYHSSLRADPVDRFEIVLSTPPGLINASYRRVGGLRFLKLGRLCFSFCVTREYRAIGA